MSVQLEYSQPPIIKQWLRLLIGLSLGVTIGLSPYLGLLKIPFFHSLLELIPFSLQNILIPLSSAAMGIVATIVVWFGEERIKRNRLNKIFLFFLVICALTFFALTIIHTLFVVTIPIKAGQESVSVLVGYSRPTSEPCPTSVSDEACIQLLSLEPAQISSFWGDKQLRIARLLLFSSYLVFTCVFAGIIGLIIIKQKIISEEKRQNSQRKASPPKNNKAIKQKPK